MSFLFLVQHPDSPQWNGLQSFFTDLDDLLASGEIVGLKPGNRTWLKYLRIKGFPPLVLKFYRHRIPVPQAMAAFRMALDRRLSTAWETSLFLYQQGVAVPTPLALLFKDWRHSIIAMEAIQGETFWDRIQKGHVLSKAIMERIGALIARIHATGVIHGDLKLANIMGKESETSHGDSNKDIEPYLIDFDSALLFSKNESHLDPRYEKGVGRDIARLLISLAELHQDPMLSLSFFEGYASKAVWNGRVVKTTLDRMERLIWKKGMDRNILSDYARIMESVIDISR